MDPQYDRRDVAWIAALRRVLDDEPCPTALADALSCMQAAGISLSYDAIRSNVEEWRRAWRAGKPWGNAGYVAKRPDGTAVPLLPALGLVAPQYGLTDAEAEERALAVALYTNDGEGRLFRVLNAEFSSAKRAALGGELSPRLRACIPFAKLLEVALSELPSDFIFCGRAWRAVRHVFPGYPGFKNLHGGPSPQVHDPERHFADGSTVCWYQFSSCSKHRQGVLDFAGWSGPSTLFELDVERGYDISRLSCFGEHESEVLLPLLTQLRVVGRPSKTCVPEGWVAGDGPTPAPYHPPGSPQYPRRLGPDRVQLKQLLEETAAEEAVDKPIVDLPSARACLRRLFAAADAKQRTTTSIPGFASLLQDVEADFESRQRSQPRVAVVGPTSSGKSTLVNALFRQLVLPTGALPNTLLPVIIGMGDGGGYSVTFGGDGLEECLLSRELAIRPSDGLSQADAFERIRQANALVRDMLRGCMRASDEPSRSLESIRLWHIKLVVPAERGREPASFEVVDCPGGGEALGAAQETGLVGAAVKRILQHCMSIAGMVLVNVKVDNIVCLDDEQLLLPYFGGTRPDAKLALTINAVEDAQTRRDAEERLQYDMVRTTLQRLGVDAVFYVSGRTILACGVAQSLMDVTSFEELRKLASLGSSANTALSLPALCALIKNDLGIDGPHREVVEHGMQEMRISGSGSLIERARLVVSSLGHETGEGASQAHLLPALESTHGGSREVLVGLYESGLFGGAGLAVEEIESRHRQHALGDICRAYAAGCSDNVAFVDFFGTFLRETWPRMQIEALLRGAINAVSLHLEERKRAVTAAQLPLDECKAELERTQRAVSELDAARRHAEMLFALWESAAKEMERAAKEMEARTHLVAAGWLEGCAKSPKGCALVPYRMRGNVAVCDVCKAKQPDGAVMASCRAEDYDVCTKCIGQLSRDGSQRAAPPVHVVQAAPLHGFQAAAGQLPLEGLATQPLKAFQKASCAALDAGLPREAAVIAAHAAGAAAFAGRTPEEAAAAGAAAGQAAAPPWLGYEVDVPPLDGDGSELCGIVIGCLSDAVDASRFATSTASEAASLFGDTRKWGNLTDHEDTMKTLMNADVHAAWRRSTSTQSLFAWSQGCGRRLLVYRSQAEDLIGAFQRWCVAELMAAIEGLMNEGALIAKLVAWAEHSANRPQHSAVALRRSIPPSDLRSAIASREIIAPPPPSLVGSISALPYAAGAFLTLTAPLSIPVGVLLGTANLSLMAAKSTFTGESSWGLGYSTNGEVTGLGFDYWESIAKDSINHVVASQTKAVLCALRLDFSQRVVTYQARLDCPAAAGDLAGQIHAFDVTEQLLRRLNQALQEIDEGSSVRHSATLETIGCTNGGAGSVGAGGTDDEGVEPGDE